MSHREGYSGEACLQLPENRRYDWYVHSVGVGGNLVRRSISQERKSISCFWALVAVALAFLVVNIIPFTSEIDLESFDFRLHHCTCGDVPACCGAYDATSGLCQRPGCRLSLPSEKINPEYRGETTDLQHS